MPLSNLNAHLYSGREDVSDVYFIFWHFNLAPLLKHMLEIFAFTFSHSSAVLFKIADICKKI